MLQLGFTQCGKDAEDVANRRLALQLRETQVLKSKIWNIVETMRVCININIEGINSIYFIKYQSFPIKHKQAK